MLELLQELPACFASVAATAEEGTQTLLLAQELRNLPTDFEVDDAASRPRLAR